MKITSAKFIKGIIAEDELLENGIPQIAFIGRSNVGKSSLINALTEQKSLAKSSSTPGHTRQINVFLINKRFYLIDLPGYGFAKGNMDLRNQILDMVDWYFFHSDIRQNLIVLIIDAKVGPTKDDIVMMKNFKHFAKKFIIVANKVDKIKKQDVEKQKKAIIAQISEYMDQVYFVSSELKMGLGLVSDQIYKAL